MANNGNRCYHSTLKNNASQLNMRLIAKNFASLSDIDILVNDVTVIIGEQASGKSLTSKLYFFLMDTVSDLVTDSIRDEAGLKSVQSALKREFTKLFPEYSWKHCAFEIQALDITQEDDGEPHISITYTPGGNGIRFAFSKIFKKEYNNIKTAFSKIKKEAAKEKTKERDEMFYAEFNAYRILRKAIESSSSKRIAHGVTYIPSGRSFFSTIKENVFGFISENIGIDPFLKNFGRYYEFAKQESHYSEKKSNEITKSFDDLAESIVKGKFSTDRKDEWIIKGDKKIALANASSGQQEALPLVMVLRRELQGSHTFGSRSIVVEEPEAHLFPVSQRAIVNLLFMAKEQAPETAYIVTTHSPYILSCINNCILNADGKVKVSAYFISNGRSKCISDHESGLVNGEELDKISGEIADEFFAALEKKN